MPETLGAKIYDAGRSHAYEGYKPRSLNYGSIKEANNAIDRFDKQLDGPGVPDEPQLVGVDYTTSSICA